MSLFINTSNLHNLLSDCPSLNISDTIERDCLSVLHKLHDQVNGLQLVQVVVQPLARLFNPASLAALAANVSSSSAASNFPNNNNKVGTTTPVQNVSGSQSSAASTPSTHYPPPIGHNNDSSADGYNHSRSQSFASSFSINQGASTPAATGNNNNSLLSTTSTYMMSPDTAQALIARLDTDRDVNWLMEIIGYGLSMPFSITGEQDSVKDCCTIYCEWLASALLPYNENNEDSKYQQLSKLVPVPIRKEPNRYARKMLSHLYNVFLPRQPVATTNNYNQKDQSEAILTAVSRQAVLCHRVLRTIENIAQNESNLMDNETWHHLLALLLTVNEKLLSAPTEPDDIGTQLQDRISGVLFELMLLACSRSIPEASLWKTFHEMCLNWRHRPALVDHWKRITLLLTKRIVQLPAKSNNNNSSNDQQRQAFDTDSTISQTKQQLHLNIPASSTSSSSSSAINTNLSALELSIATMSYETLIQTWYRFLNLLGNPVELADPSAISRTDEFYHAACMANNVLDPRQHPCLNVLPQIFMNSMRGLRDFIESFLGTYHCLASAPTMATTPINSSRRASQADALQQQIQQQQQAQEFKLKPDRPKCNAILHIFGDWLFGAALIGSDMSQELGEQTSSEPYGGVAENISGSTTSVASSATEVAGGGGATTPSNYSPLLSRRQSHQSTTSSHASISTTNTQTSKARRQSKQWLGAGSVQDNSDKMMTLDAPLSADSFESGQAEAMATLCRIFSSKISTEDICPAYLARFYLCLQHCLAYGSGLDSRGHQSGPIKRQLLASVLMNSTTLLQKDLDGINLLIPSFIKAIEFVFECSDKEAPAPPIQAPPRQHSNRSGSIRFGGAASNNAAFGAGSNNLTNITNYDLRRACILTLVNLLAYPFHFQELIIRSCLDGTSPNATFGSLRPKLLKLLFVALQTETDATNMQVLFGGLSLAIHDLASNIAKVTPSSCSGSSSAPSRARKNTTDSAHSSLDTATTSGKQQEDAISQSSFVFNSTDGFLIKSLHVTCHLLINIWKHDNLVSLAALEVLTSIARVSDNIQRASVGLKTNSTVEMKGEYMQTTRWICDYICNQCSRPPPAHSRDMHSTIVAAYQCLSVWFYNHSYLLNDSQCVNTLMEVIELGVSGQKSKSTSVNPTVGVATQTIISKGEKHMKPSSMRVREAAESLLNICMVRNCLSGQRNIALCDTVLNELDILEAFNVGFAANLGSKKQQARQQEALKMFKYFSDDDSILFGLFETANQQQTEPTNKDSVICLLRTPFGKHCWRIKFNYYSERSREKIIANKTHVLIKKPFQQQQPTTPSLGDGTTSRHFPFSLKGQNNKLLYFNQEAKFFPETIETLAPNSLDQLVASLSDYVEKGIACREPGRLKSELDKMDKMLAHQVMAEQKVISECCMKVRRNECDEPQQTNDLEMARMVANQLGLSTGLSCLTRLESFAGHLSALDGQSARTCDSVNVYYVRRQRTTPLEILESVRERRNVSLEFFEWLLELGQPTVVRQHSRWTGKTYGGAQNSTSSLTRADSSEGIRNQMLTSDHGGAIFDGDRMSLYWSDMCQEVAFLVPHRLEKCKELASNIIICWLESADDLGRVPCDALLSSALLESSQTPPPPTGASGGQFLTVGAALAAEEAARAAKDCVKYFISPMKNGLFRVNLVSSLGRQWLALPLVDGMTVSKMTLASLIRESVLNVCRRRRLDADSYQPPHVKRRLKIQEICNNYKISSRNEPAHFYHNLFRTTKTSTTAVI